MDIKTVLPFKMQTSSDAERNRFETFWEKEPETINWIKSFPEDNIFLDIGANVGIYTLYNAHLHKQSLTVAIEPFLANYLSLHNNIQMNGFTNAMPLPIALSDENAFLPIYVPDHMVGASGGQLNDPVDAKGRKFNIVGGHDVMTFRLFTFLAMFTHLKKRLQPTHIKIDVDGHEGKILDGFVVEDTPYDYCVYDSLQSMLVEFNHPQTRELWERILGEKGFITDNEFNRFTPHSNDRRGREPDNQSVNIIFTKKESLKEVDTDAEPAEDKEQK
jgi:FkbM family methyltransferase